MSQGVLLEKSSGKIGPEGGPRAISSTEGVSKVRKISFSRQYRGLLPCFTSVEQLRPPLLSISVVLRMASFCHGRSLGRSRRTRRLFRGITDLLDERAKHPFDYLLSMLYLL